MADRARVGRVPTEAEVQRLVRATYEAVGCHVANFSQGYRPGGKRHGTTRQTKGIPDLYVFPPMGRGLAPWWHETKRPGGVQSIWQRSWEMACLARDVGYVLGGVDAALMYLRSLGLVV